MPFQEDRCAEDVPNLLSARIRGSYTMDGTADFSLFKLRDYKKEFIEKGNDIIILSL